MIVFVILGAAAVGPVSLGSLGTSSFAQTNNTRGGLNSKSPYDVTPPAIEGFFKAGNHVFLS
jgi:hypothetical protein